MTRHAKFAFDVGLTLGATSASILVGFGVSVLLGRTLGADDLGLYKMVSTICGMAALVAGLGIPATVIKYASENKEDRVKTSEVVSSGLITSLLVGLAFIGVIYLTSGLFQDVFGMDGLGRLLRIVSLYFPFALLTGVLLGLLNGLRFMREFAIATILQSLLMLTTSVLLIYAGLGVEGITIAMVISPVGTFMYLALVCRRHFSITFERFKDNVRMIVTFGSQVLGANLVNMVNYHGDLILVGFFMTATDVGYYGVAVALAKFFWLLPQAMQTITYPAISEHWKKRELQSIRKTVDKTTKYAAFVLLPAGFVVGLYAPQIIEFILGKGFEEAVLPLRILLIGTVVNGVMQRPIGSVLFSIGLPGLNLRIFGFVAVISMCLNIALIPSYGMAGAAVAGSVGYLALTALMLFVTWKKTTISLDWPWFIYLGLISGAGLAACVALFLVGWNIIGLAVVVTLATSMWFCLFNDEDRNRVLGLAREGIHRFIF